MPSNFEIEKEARYKDAKPVVKVGEIVAVKPVPDTLKTVNDGSSARCAMVLGCGPSDGE